MVTRDLDIDLVVLFSSPGHPRIRIRIALQFLTNVASRMYSFLGTEVTTTEEKEEEEEEEALIKGNREGKSRSSERQGLGGGIVVLIGLLEDEGRG